VNGEFRVYAGEFGDTIFADMSWSKMICLLFAISVAIAQTQTSAGPPPSGSVSGTVTDMFTGAPLLGLTVAISVARPSTGVILSNDSTSAVGSAATDAQGGYRIPGLLPGDYVVAIRRRERETLGSKNISLAAGQDLTNLNFSVGIPGSISGTVTDSAKQPAAGTLVILIQEMYQGGKTTWAQVDGTSTDAAGRYLMTSVRPGRAYRILAKPIRRQIPALSAAPDDMEKRKPTLAPTYYPDVRRLEGGQTITLGSGQSIEGVNIQIAQLQSYCAEGVMGIEGVPAELDFEISDGQPSNGGYTGSSGGFILRPPAGTTGRDGRFRICDLPPGEYVLRATGKGTQSGLTTAVPLIISDRDAKALRVNALPGMRITGEVAWDGDKPAQAPDAKMTIDLLGKGQNRLRWPRASSSLPGEFTLDGVYPEEYAIRTFGAPAGSYVKDVTYGVISVLHRSLIPGSAVGDASLRVVVARDGGTLSARVTDKDGNPVQSASICFLPAQAGTSAELETVFTCSTTDAAGIGASGTLRPGKYRVLATNDPVDHSAESIDRLWGARLKGNDVELSAKGSMQVRVEPVPLY
jgi:protocatechuate 3,4-dioxygenase beta subunit